MNSSDEEEESEAYFDIRDFIRRRLPTEEAEYFDAIEHALADHLTDLGDHGRGVLLDQIRLHYPDHGDGGGGNPHGLNEAAGGGEEEDEMDVDDFEIDQAVIEENVSDDSGEYMEDALGLSPESGDNHGDRAVPVNLGADENAQQEFIVETQDRPGTPHMALRPRSPETLSASAIRHIFPTATLPESSQSRLSLQSVLPAQSPETSQHTRPQTSTFDSPESSQSQHTHLLASVSQPYEASQSQHTLQQAFTAQSQQLPQSNHPLLPSTTANHSMESFLSSTLRPASNQQFFEYSQSMESQAALIARIVDSLQSPFPCRQSPSDPHSQQYSLYRQESESKSSETRNHLQPACIIPPSQESSQFPCLHTINQSRGSNDSNYRTPQAMSEDDEDNFEDSHNTVKPNDNNVERNYADLSNDSERTLECSYGEIKCVEEEDGRIRQEHGRANQSVPQEVYFMPNQFPPSEAACAAADVYETPLTMSDNDEIYEQCLAVKHDHMYDEPLFSEHHRMCQSIVGSAAKEDGSDTGNDRQTNQNNCSVGHDHDNQAEETPSEHASTQEELINALQLVPTVTPSSTSQSHSVIVPDHVDATSKTPSIQAPTATPETIAICEEPSTSAVPELMEESTRTSSNTLIASNPGAIPRSDTTQDVLLNASTSSGIVLCSASATILSIDGLQYPGIPPASGVPPTLYGFVDPGTPQVSGTSQTIDDFRFPTIPTDSGASTILDCFKHPVTPPASTTSQLLDDNGYPGTPPAVVASTALDDLQYPGTSPSVVASTALDDLQYPGTPPAVVASTARDDLQYPGTPPAVVASTALDDLQHPGTSPSVVASTTLDDIYNPDTPPASVTSQTIDYFQYRVTPPDSSATVTVDCFKYPGTPPASVSSTTEDVLNHSCIFPNLTIAQIPTNLIDLDTVENSFISRYAPTPTLLPYPGTSPTSPMLQDLHITSTESTSTPQLVQHVDVSSTACTSPPEILLHLYHPSADPGTSQPGSSFHLDILPHPGTSEQSGSSQLRASPHQGSPQYEMIPQLPTGYPPHPQYPATPENSMTPDETATPERSSTPDYPVTPQYSASPDFPGTPEQGSTPEPMSEDDSLEDGVAVDQEMYEEARFEEMFEEARMAAEQQHLLDDDDGEVVLNPHEHVIGDNVHVANMDYVVIQPIVQVVEQMDANNGEEDVNVDNNDEGFIGEVEDRAVVVNQQALVNANVDMPQGVYEHDGHFQINIAGQVINVENWQQWVNQQVNRPAPNDAIVLQQPLRVENAEHDGNQEDLGYIQNIFDDNGNVIYTIYGINYGENADMIQGVYAHPDPIADGIDGDDELSDDGPIIGPLYTLSREGIPDMNVAGVARLAIEQGHSSTATCEDNPERVDWSLLPMNIVTEIMRYLSDVDRVKIAKTCKKWHGLLNSAVLWRVRIIRFHGSGTKAKSEAKRLKGWANSHGHWIQRLSIYCDHPSYVVCRTFQKAMTDFFGTLLWQKAILKRFCMRRLYVERYWRYDAVRERLVGSLSRFFKRQNHLQFIDLSDGHWGLLNGLKILEAVAQGCKGNRRLTTVNFEDFFSSRLSLFRLPRYQNILTRFKGLTMFYTNYSCLSEEIVETLARNCEGRLKMLSVKIYRTEPHTHVISPLTWRLATRLCPKLRAEVYIEGMGNFDDIGGILSKDMPLRMLQIWTGIHPVDQQWKTDRLFTHIGAHYANTLEESYMSVEPEGEPVDGPVVEMLERCKLLDSMDLQTTLLVDTLDTIYRKVDENKIMATRLHINLNNLTGVEMEALDVINDSWAHLVDERQLNFVFEANELVLF